MAPQRAEERPIAALIAPDILVLLQERPGDIEAETSEIHPADLADVAALLPADRVPELLRALPSDRAADILEYLDEELRTQVLEAMSAVQAAAIVTQMTPDDRADALEELEDEHADEILSEISFEARGETEELLAHAPDTAGGLMTTQFGSVLRDITVDDALGVVRAMARSGRNEAMHNIYVTDTEGRLQGVLSLRELLAAPEGTRVSEVAWTDVVAVSPTTDREEVQRIISKYDLVSVPVVDETNRVRGVVTVDDVIDAMQEEQTEDVQKLGGMAALDEPYTQIGFVSMIRKRGGWLSALFLSEMLTATAMQHFDMELQRAAVLVLFVPLVMSSGGNSGSQATSLIIRAMALGEVRLADWWQVARRELASGVVLGAILGVIGIIRVLAWQTMWLHDTHLGGFRLGYDYGIHYRLLALTVGCALVGIVTFGSVAGSMLPFVLRRIGFDPASASAPFVATLVDVTGLSIYFYVALVILRGTLL
ncbi:MAG: magnesium transporter [Gemmatimonadaceae bacterium]